MVHLTSGVRFRHRFLDVLVLPGSDERAAGFGEDRFVRWSPPIFTPRCEAIYQEGFSEFQDSTPGNHSLPSG